MPFGVITEMEEVEEKESETAEMRQDRYETVDLTDADNIVIDIANDENDNQSPPRIDDCVTSHGDISDDDQDDETTDLISSPSPPSARHNEPYQLYTADDVAEVMRRGRKGIIIHAIGIGIWLFGLSATVTGYYYHNINCSDNYLFGVMAIVNSSYYCIVAIMNVVIASLTVYKLHQVQRYGILNTVLVIRDDIARQNTAVQRLLKRRTTDERAVMKILEMGERKARVDAITRGIKKQVVVGKDKVGESEQDVLLALTTVLNTLQEEPVMLADPQHRIDIDIIGFILRMIPIPLMIAFIYAGIGSLHDEKIWLRTHRGLESISKSCLTAITIYWVVLIVCVIAAVLQITPVVKDCIIQARHRLALRQWRDKRSND